LLAVAGPWRTVIHEWAVFVNRVGALMFDRCHMGSSRQFEVGRADLIAK
jgi:hypothetical protein